jgi:hypothetical protein
MVAKQEKKEKPRNEEKVKRKQPAFNLPKSIKEFLFINSNGDIVVSNGRKIEQRQRQTLAYPKHASKI